MPTKRVVKQKQKQKQRQSVTVNVNVAKSRSKSSAKKSGAKSKGRGSVMMLPPPIYASSIDRLTPAMYGSQGQQIQQKSMEDLLKNFLSNQQNQQTNTGFRSLGGEPQLTSKSEFIPYDDSSDKSFKSLGSASNSYYYPGSSSESYRPKSYTSGSSNPDYVSGMSNTSSTIRGDPIPDNVSEMTDPSYMSDPFSRSSQYSLASPFSTDSLDYESTAPKFSQDEARVSQKNIYESIKNLEPAATDRSSKHFYDLLNRMEEKTQKEIDKLEMPEPFRRPERRPPIRLQIDDDEMTNSTFSTDSLETNPFPKNMYNKMMGFN
jgi:hypothetical protein